MLFECLDLTTAGMLACASPARLFEPTLSSIIGDLCGFAASTACREHVEPAWPSSLLCWCRVLPDGARAALSGNALLANLAPAGLILFLCILGLAR
jgi:hypothetical protein